MDSAPSECEHEDILDFGPTQMSIKLLLLEKLCITMIITRHHNCRRRESAYKGSIDRTPFVVVDQETGAGEAAVCRDKGGLNCFIMIIAGRRIVYQACFLKCLFLLLVVLKCMCCNRG